MRRENKWIFSKDEIENSPSRATMSLSKENEMRRVACKFIQNVAKASRLNLSRSTVVTAQTLLHRYYMRKSFQDNPWDVSIGVIFLASKLSSEYSSRITKYLIHECARIAKKISNPRYELNPNEKEYGYWKNNMNYYEMEMLRVLCFDLTFDEPFSYCEKMCQKINASKEEKAVACYLLDESFIRTTLCLQYHSIELASGALLLSLYQNKQSDMRKKEILSLFKEQNLSLNHVKAVANELKSMIIKMDENVSPVHSQNASQHHAYASGNGYSKMYNQPVKPYIRSPLSQDANELVKQTPKMNSNYHNSSTKLNQQPVNVYSSPLASPVSFKDMNMVDHTTTVSNNIKNLSNHDYFNKPYPMNNKSASALVHNYYNNHSTSLNNKYSGGRSNINNKMDLSNKYKTKKQEKLRQKSIYFNNNSRITKYHVTTTYTKINSNLTSTSTTTTTMTTTNY